MAAKPLQLVSNRPTEVEALTTSAGVGDSGKLVALDAAGRLSTTMMPVGIGADTASIVASEALAAGDFVTVWNDTGTAKVRKANASTASAGGLVHGFVLDSSLLGANALVYFEGPNTQLTGLTIGATYALSHTVPGGVVVLASATSTAGHILQIVGVAVSATALNFERSEPIVRA